MTVSAGGAGVDGGISGAGVGWVVADRAAWVHTRGIRITGRV